MARAQTPTRQHVIVFDLDLTLTARPASTQKPFTTEERIAEFKKIHEAATLKQPYRPPLELDFKNNCRFEENKRGLIELCKNNFLGRVAICTNSSLTPAEIHEYLKINFEQTCQELQTSIEEIFPMHLIQTGNNCDETKTSRLNQIRETLKLDHTEKYYMLFIDDNLKHTYAAIRDGMASFCFYRQEDDQICPAQELFDSINKFLLDPKSYFEKQHASLPKQRAACMLNGDVGKALTKLRLGSTSAIPGTGTGTTNLFRRQASAPALQPSNPPDTDIEHNTDTKLIPTNAKIFSRE